MQSSYFGRGTGTILTSGAQCNGSELQLIDCERTSLIGICNHGHDVGVICHGEFGTLHTLSASALHIHKKYVHAEYIMHAPKQNKNKQTNKEAMTVDVIQSYP